LLAGEQTALLRLPRRVEQPVGHDEFSAVDQSPCHSGRRDAVVGGEVVFGQRTVQDVEVVRPRRPDPMLCADSNPTRVDLRQVVQREDGVIAEVGIGTDARDRRNFGLVPRRRAL
jgi:hypothetical protein